MLAWFKQLKEEVGFKIGLMAFALALITAGILGVGFYNKTKTILINEKLEDIKDDVKKESFNLKNAIEILRQDINVLTQTPPIQGIIRAKQAGGIDPLDGSTEKIWKQRLATIFKGFLISRPYYDHIRYIGLEDNGRELVRVNRDADTIKIVPDSDLQPKAHRSYFQKIIKLGENQVYLSEINLNQEQGKVATPHQPVIRAAYPIFNSEGEIFGVVAINMDFGLMLERIAKAGSLQYIVNEAGDFLMHPDPGKTFGFDLGKNYRIQESYSELSGFLSAGVNNREISLTIETDGIKNAVYFLKVPFDPQNPERFIGLVRVISYRTILAGLAEFSNYIIVLVLVVVAGAGVLAYFISLILTRPLKQKTRVIMENVDDSLITIDEQGMIDVFNPAAERAFGYSASEVVGKNVKMLMPEPYYSEHDGYLQNYRETGEKKIIGIGREVVGQRKDGSVFPLDLRVNEMEIGGRTMYVGICRDITERRRIEQSLRDTEEKFHQLANNIHEIFWIVSADLTEMIYISKAYETVWGRPCEDLMKNIMDWAPSLHPEDRDRVLGLFNFEDLAAGNFNLEYRIVRPDGSIRWVHVEGLPVRNEAGEIFRFAGIAQDITERKLAEEEKAKANKELEQQNWLKTHLATLNDKMRGDQDSVELTQNIINCLAEILEARIGAIYLAEGDVLKMTADFAVTRHKIVSKEFRIGEGLVGKAALEKQNIMIPNVPKDYFRVTSGLGDALPANLMIVPFLHEGAVTGVAELGSFDPLNDRKREFLNQAGEHIAVALNSALARKQMAELLAKTQVQAEELIIQKEELEQTHEEMQEINRQLEEQTQSLEEQTEKLAAAGQYKTEFLANMSHELRTPLNSLLILSQLLSQNKDKNLTEKQVEFAQTIHDAGSDLLDLINDILDLSKVESGKMELHLEAINLRNLAESLEKTFMPIAEQKRLHFKTEISEEIPAFIQTDFQRVEQIIKNFLSNAFKFTEKGSVSLKFHPVEPGAQFFRTELNSQKVVGVSVSDTGKGISREKQDRIFEAFLQEDGTTSRKYGGTGLGLSISKELAHLLGGEVTIKSEEGEGSTFTVYLPERFSASQKYPKETPGDLWKSQAKSLPGGPVSQSILIIEDDPRFSKIVFEAAQKKGFESIVVGSGELGLELAENKRPTAIILDINLPGIDGLEVIKQLQANPATRNIPVYCISVQDDKAKKILNMGAVDFMKKPVNLEALESVFIKISRFSQNTTRQILVVEDDQVVRDSIIDLLANDNINLFGAATANEAIQKLRKHTIDCMILDLILSKKSGFDLLREIKNDKNLPEVPVIIYTAKHLTRSQEEELMHFSKSIIIKGTKSPERLLNEVNGLLYGTKQFSEEKFMSINPTHSEDGDFNFQGKKVLVADDDVRNIFALTHLLKDKEIDVIVAKSGREAIAILKANPDTDLVLMDIMMPDTDGYTAIQEIRSDANCKDIPIIAVTAKAMKKDKQKCLDAGASDYLSKPIDSNELFTQMKALFQSSG